MKKTSPLQYIIIYSLLLVAVAWSIYPILRVITISIRPGDNLLNESLQIIPDDWTFQNYITLFTDHPFGTWIWNSILVTVTVMITGVALASTAGYALSRFKFPGREASLLSLLVTQMFPATMLLLPLFIMLSSLHLINTYLGLIVIYSSTALPFCVWQMKGYYDTIPYSLEEAARIDGASRFMAFYKIILPLASPALVITALFSLPIGLKSFQANMTTEWGLYAAGAMIVSIPAIALFLFLTKYLIGGLTLGSVKG